MKTPAAATATTSAPNSANSTRPRRITPRQQRVISALWSAKRWIPREEIDRIAGASNGPQVIKELRERFTGHDGIDMERIEVTDRDGKACRPGRYKLNHQGRDRIAQAAQSGVVDLQDLEAPNV
jgi:hypothetical protein